MTIDIRNLLHPRHRRVLVAAHRGACQWAPENSLAAIEEAITLGADIVECDVRATRDGVLVLLHDPTLDRTTTRQGAIAALDWREAGQGRLKGAGGGPGAAVTGQRLATLAEALECARGRIVLNIDTKVPALAEAVARMVVAAGMADQVFVKATINTEADLVAVNTSPFFDHVPFVPMLTAGLGEVAPALQRLAPQGFPMYEVAFAAVADLAAARPELERQQARLWVNTIQVSHSLDLNDQRALATPEAVWGALVDLGVGAIQTDVVADLVAYLASRGAR